jgi:hypothetical protein
MKKPLVIYKNNLDGKAAAWCFKSQYGDDFEYSANIGPSSDIFNREVYILGFTYSYEVMEMLCKFAKNVTVIDNDINTGQVLWNLDIELVIDSKSNIIAIAFTYIKKKMKHRRKLPGIFSKYISEATTLDKYITKANL